MEFFPETSLFSETYCVLVSVLGSTDTRVFNISPQLYFHNANCYEFGNGRYVVVDTIATRGMDFDMKLSSLSPDIYTNKDWRPTCERVVLDLLTGEVKQETLIGRSVDGFYDVNPAVSGRPNQYTFMGCSGVYNEDHDNLWGPNQVNSLKFWSFVGNLKTSACSSLFSSS